MNAIFSCDIFMVVVIVMVRDGVYGARVVVGRTGRAELPRGEAERLPVQWTREHVLVQR
jgi:hypothetical protein